MVPGQAENHEMTVNRCPKSGNLSESEVKRSLKAMLRYHWGVASRQNSRGLLAIA